MANTAITTTNQAALPPTGLPPVVLCTPRLRLRPWRAQDLYRLAAMHADPRVMAHFPACMDRAESDAFAARCQGLIAERGWGFWAVERRAVADWGGHDWIGAVGLHVPAATLPFSSPQRPAVEIGWRLIHDTWGHGFAHEAAQAALTDGFTRLGLQEIVAFTALGNQRSQQLMRRLHMERDSAGDFDHPSLPAGHPLQAHCLYRLARTTHRRPAWWNEFTTQAL